MVRSRHARVTAAAVGAFLILAPGSVGGQAQKAVAAGPVAISMSSPDEGFVLRSDGSVLALNVARKSVAEHYRVPAEYEPMDLAVARGRGGPTLYLTINEKHGKGSFLLQVDAAKRETWTHLAHTGLFIGLVVDSAKNAAYVTQPYANKVFRVALGDEKGRVAEVASFPIADRIGPIAIDADGKRLFVADMDGSHLFVVTLAGGAIERIELPKVSEIRALAWNDATSRLYLADAGNERIWSLPIAAGAVPARFKKRFPEPSGLAVTGPDTMWVVDESERVAVKLELREEKAGTSIKLEIKR